MNEYKLSYADNSVMIVIADTMAHALANALTTTVVEPLLLQVVNFDVTVVP